MNKLRKNILASFIQDVEKTAKMLPKRPIKDGYYGGNYYFSFWKEEMSNMIILAVPDRYLLATKKWFKTTYIVDLTIEELDIAFIYLYAKLEAEEEANQIEKDIQLELILKKIERISKYSQNEITK